MLQSFLFYTSEADRRQVLLTKDSQVLYTLYHIRIIIIIFDYNTLRFSIDELSYDQRFNEFQCR